MTIECRKRHRKEHAYGTEEPPLEQQKILLLHDGFYLESDPAEEDNGLFKRCSANLSGELVWSLQQTGFRRFSLSSIFSAMDGAESADFFHRAVFSVTARNLCGVADSLPFRQRDPEQRSGRLFLWLLRWSLEGLDCIWSLVSTGFSRIISFICSFMNCISTGRILLRPSGWWRQFCLTVFYRGDNRADNRMKNKYWEKESHWLSCGRKSGSQWLFLSRMSWEVSVYSD